MKLRWLRAPLYLLLLFIPSEVQCQILQLAELNTNQIRALDRAKTVVLIPGGILEEHGPYLPSFTDGYVDAAVTQELARSIVARPGWTVLIFPAVPLGFGGANGIGAKWSYPGSYTVRFETLRAVYMDLSSELGEQGFRSGRAASGTRVCSSRTACCDKRGRIAGFPPRRRGRSRSVCRETNLRAKSCRR